MRSFSLKDSNHAAAAQRCSVLRNLHRTLAAPFCSFVGILILAASDASAHGDYHDVVEKLSKLIVAEPENAKLRYQLAAAHVGHDEWELALEECDLIEKIAPGKFQLGYFRGRSLATAKRWKEALAPLYQFIAAAPADEEAHIWRARVHSHLGETQKATADYRTALEKSRNASHHTEFAKSLLEQNRPQEAVAALQHGLKLTREDPALLECMVECATAAKDHEAALTAIDRLIQVWPRPEPWMQRRAKRLTSMGRIEDALTAWIALDAHLKKLPTLDRAQPFLLEIQAETNAALGLKSTTPVSAPPATN